MQTSLSVLSFQQDGNKVRTHIQSPLWSPRSATLLSGDGDRMVHANEQTLQSRHLQNGLESQEMEVQWSD